jgi:hypothetical protein
MTTMIRLAGCANASPSSAQASASDQSSTLLEAIAQARAIAQERGVCPEFRDATRRARELLERYAEALVASEPIPDDDPRKLEGMTEQAVARLEALATAQERPPH